MIEKILEKLGYIKIDKIIVPYHYTRPNKEKISYKEFYYSAMGVFEDTVILDENNTILDGFTTYWICKKWERKYVRFKRCEREKYKHIDDIYTNYIKNKNKEKK